MAGKRAAGEGTVRKRPDGRWHARRSIGPRGSAKTYHGYGPTRADAVADLNRKIKQAAKQQKRSLNTVDRWRMSDFFDWWVEEELAGRVADGTMATTTAKSYTQAVRLHLKPMLKGIRLADIRAVHVRKMLDTARRKKLSNRHRAYLHTVLSAALGCAVRYEMIEVANPATLVEAPKTTKARREGTDLAHARALLEAAQGDRLEAYWRVMLSAPLRPGEPRAMVWDDLDLDAGAYRVWRNLVRIEGRWEFHDCKGHQARTIPLGEPTVAALRRRKADLAKERLAAGVGWKGADVIDVDGTLIRPQLVFCNDDGSPIHQTWIARALERLCEEAGIPRMTPHGLRHAANTLLRAGGVSEAVIQQLAGHATLAMTDHYTGTLPKPMRDAVEQLSAAVQP